MSTEPQKRTSPWVIVLSIVGGILLLGVVACAGILALGYSFVSTAVKDTQERANVAAARAQVGLLKTPINTFYLDVGRYPTSEEGLGALRQQPPAAANWAGPYLDEPLALDPWGNAYQYQAEADAGFRVWSYGPDGKDGTPDDIESNFAVEASSP